MATLKDVAALAGVSMSTAGAAMRGEDIVKPATKEKVLAAARELGYSANLSARFLKKGSTGAIAVMVPDILHPYYTNLVSAVCSAASKHGLRTVIQQTGYNSTTETSVLKQINATLCDGLILNVNNVDDQHLRGMLGNHPTVLLNYPADVPLFDTVRGPAGSSASTAFGYLCGRGYRHACVVGGRPARAENSDTSGRDDGIRAVMDALIGNGLGETGDFVECNWSVAGGIEAAHALCAAGDDGARPVDRYDVFYCMNDLIAYGLIRGLHEEGVRVPDDKAVFGHDGIFNSGVLEPFTVPTLTTVGVDYADMATKAVDLLIDQIKHPGKQRAPRIETARGRLIVGESA
ncbi:MULTISPECIES: LacI family DNA-binding transcriptional regulator [Bifidobacterium]|uniref:LacI family DNA-binding transcriptional regulator n=1 Tax=Bifidobacterium TaxID=1678 RepID=UPI001BDD682B|nr:MULTISPECIES: LacI family DNA-binding transcriptional regulator [Bifidobacterium]MBT1161888.1 LacI family DNA-binding transcriptional regulator [Bifidobacterium sp. SO1]MBW3079406.1 LacI family DNA-binding transcriptional regulator [Bifidobacterium simiiventris]